MGRDDTIHLDPFCMICDPGGRVSEDGPLAQLVEQQTLNLWVAGSKPAWLRGGWVSASCWASFCLPHLFRARVVESADTLDLGSSASGMRVQVPPLAGRLCGNSSVVERHLAKVEVAGSIPVSRFFSALLHPTWTVRGVADVGISS